MTIEFHCSRCGKLVRTTEENAGKFGKCPGCHQSVYIPTPSEDLEPLRLAPVDEKAERERHRLEQEARELAQKLRDETDVPPEAARAPLPEPVGDARLAPDMEGMIIEYAVHMSQGRLNEAQELANEIRQDLPRAQEAIQRLVGDELPPKRWEKIPRPVLLKFLRQLRESG